MSMLAVDRAARVSSFNAVAKLAATLVTTVTLLLSIDAVSAGVTLVCVLALMPFTGLSARVLWLRSWPLLTAAVLGAAATILYGRPAGDTYLQWGLVHVTDGSFQLALAILLRVLAIALPAVVLLSTTDPTDLADGLSQRVRLPARFVLGALAGLRLVGLLVEDWRELSLARRARGVADTGRLRRFLGQSFALFVLAIRRGTKLATAMEARGFGAPGARTWARPSVLRPRDTVLVLIAVAIAAASAAIALAAGTWTFVWAL
ncbi:energy-coupling factor transporter transmembrane protein EcfT [Microbacterium sp. SYP-A9085]|uniref:energy-coupling factor transporter transmembrane component T family protein n=1 Tax=Microbacterium sp. SYP-A9085 TaxID=2664454 RepID=UPI00129A343D|nr:energy-coupling factor transporter transmembrane component T [Microbacterium sp. SYP-A9085]MRH28109.1 energy-coupling factor transporter transmembrane protein EcfT [Microbacterium sp. SYP-A9085]